MPRSKGWHPLNSPGRWIPFTAFMDRYPGHLQPSDECHADEDWVSVGEITDFSLFLRIREYLIIVRSRSLVPSTNGGPRIALGIANVLTAKVSEHQ